MNVDINEHLNLLGYRARDRITGISGIVTSICFDLYGCVQALINRGLDKDGKEQEMHWMDTNRLEIDTNSRMSGRVMNLPNFLTYARAMPAGPEDKPSTD